MEIKVYGTQERRANTQRGYTRSGAVEDDLQDNSLNRHRRLTRITVENLDYRTSHGRGDLAADASTPFPSRTIYQDSDLVRSETHALPESGRTSRHSQACHLAANVRCWNDDRWKAPKSVRFGGVDAP